MVNSQSLIKIASFFAIAVVIYALRPMPEYALHARTAAGMYEASDINEQEALEGLQRLTASVEAEMIGAQAMLDLPYVPDEAIEQLNHHLMELNKLSQSMHSQLIARFGEERLEDMVNLPNWATETVALTQVLNQPSQKPLTTLSKSKHRQLQGNLQWVERALSDLQEMILRAMPTTTTEPVAQASQLIN